MTLTPIHPLWPNFAERFWHSYNKYEAGIQCPTARQVLHEMQLTDSEINSTLVEFFLRVMNLACDGEILAAL